MSKLVWCLAIVASASVAQASPQAELERLAAPWRRAASWLTGDDTYSASVKAKAALRSRVRRKLQEPAAWPEEPAAAATAPVAPVAPVVTTPAPVAYEPPPAVEEPEEEEEEELSAEELAEEREKELEEEAYEESRTKWGFVVGILGLGATFIGGYILESMHVQRLPEAGVGLLVGALISGSAVAGGYEIISAHEKFDFEFFMTWLLPPIIFEAGYNMNVNKFVANLYPTMFFAFIGTFASTFVVGGIVFQAGQMGLCYPMGMLAALTFGSLISATDPVTVLAVFQALGVKVDLFSMVFGESVLNDAVAIVLSRTLLSFNKPGVEVDSESIQAAGVSFCVIFGGSLIIGAVFGVVSSLVFKKMDMMHHSELIFMQSSLSFAFPWAAYFTSEALELSGIVTILFCGMIMAEYTRWNFSPEAQTLTAQGYKCVAQVAETYVFVYLGMAVFTFPIFQSTVGMLCVVATLACFVGRLHIYIGSWLTNCCRGETSDPPPITGIYMFVMWFSGLRGGVAFALASVSYASLDFPTTCGGLTDEQKVGREECEDPAMSDSLAILQTTLIIASFTIFVFGGAITEVAIACDVLKKKGEKEPFDPADVVEVGSCRMWLLECLVVPDGIASKLKGGHEEETRFDAAVEQPYQAAEPASPPPLWGKGADAPAPAGPSATELKSKLGEKVSVEDKLDELRDVFPGKSGDVLKKALDEYGGDVQQTIIGLQAKGFD